MDDNNNRTVTIDVREYRALVECKRDIDFITRLALGGAKLAWNRSALYFDDTTIGTIIEFLDPIGYADKLKELQEA